MPEKQRKSKSGIHHRSINGKLNIQARAGSHEPYTTFSNLCFSETREMNFVVDRGLPRQCRLLSHGQLLSLVKVIIVTQSWEQSHTRPHQYLDTRKGILGIFFSSKYPTHMQSFPRNIFYIVW